MDQNLFVSCRPAAAFVVLWCHALAHSAGRSQPPSVIMFAGPLFQAHSNGVHCKKHMKTGLARPIGSCVGGKVEPCATLATVGASIDPRDANGQPFTPLTLSLSHPHTPCQASAPSMDPSPEAARCKSLAPAPNQRVSIWQRTQETAIQNENVALLASPTLSAPPVPAHTWVPASHYASAARPRTSCSLAQEHLWPPARLAPTFTSCPNIPSSPLGRDGNTLPCFLSHPLQFVPLHAALSTAIGSSCSPGFALLARTKRRPHPCLSWLRLPTAFNPAWSAGATNVLQSKAARATGAAVDAACGPRSRAQCRSQPVQGRASLPCRAPAKSGDDADGDALGVARVVPCGERRPIDQPHDMDLDCAQRARVATRQRRQARGRRQRAPRLLVLAGHPQAGQRDRLPWLGRA